MTNRVSQRKPPKRRPMPKKRTLPKRKPQPKTRTPPKRKPQRASQKRIPIKQSIRPKPIYKEPMRPNKINPFSHRGFLDDKKELLKNQFNLNERDLSYKVDEIMPISINDSEDVPSMYLFARLISYVKKLSKLTGMPMDGDNILEMYYNMSKNKPISEEAKKHLTIITEHISCENKKQQVYHFYLTRHNERVPEEHQPILENNNPDITYNVVFIKETENNGYEPIDNIICSHDKDTVFVVSSIGYTQDEFELLTKVLKDIDKSITKKESTILLHDTEYYLLKGHDFPHMRKVVNCYNKDFIHRLESTKNIPELEKEEKKLMSEYTRKKENNEDAEESSLTWYDFHLKLKKIKSDLGDTNPLYKLTLSSSYNYDKRDTIDDVSIYKYTYFQKQRAESHLVTDTWWYHYFNRTLPCARGRVIQFGGTCWFNTVLNTMLLSTPVKNYLKETLVYSDSFKPYLKENFNSYNELDGYTFTYTTPETISLLSKDKTTIDTETHYHELRKTVSSNIFSDPFNAFFYGRLHSTLHLDDKVLLSLSKLLNPNKMDGGLSSFIHNLFDIMSLPYEYHVISFFKRIDFVPSVLDYLNKSTKKFVLIGNYMYCGKDSLPLKVGSYHLEAAGINSNGHAIIGLHCNGIPYMYDSNNIIAQSNWPEIDFSGYFEKVMELDDKPFEGMNYMNYFSFLLYCK